jgi:hypothetical protein
MVGGIFLVGDNVLFVGENISLLSKRRNVDVKKMFIHTLDYDGGDIDCDSMRASYDKSKY